MSTAAERNAACESLAKKVRTYVNEASVHGRSTQFDLQGLPEYAAELAKDSDRTTLLGLSREVDSWLREVHQPSDALLLVAKMRSRGVRDSELPVLAAARRLKLSLNGASWVPSQRQSLFSQHLPTRILRSSWVPAP